ncbi:MAG: hypothetical protein BZ138_08240, partial [Methanosphaera sp. rholeuAM270]
MNNKNIKRMFLFLTLMVLLIGVVSATEIADDQTSSTTIKDTTQASPIVTANVESNDKIINKQTTDNVKTGDVSTTSKSNTTKTNIINKTYKANATDYKQLVNQIKKANNSTYATYMINLKKGNYDATANLTWKNTNTKLIINANNSVINGQNKYKFLYIGSDSTAIINNITLTKFKSYDGGAIEN